MSVRAVIFAGVMCAGAVLVSVRPGCSGGDEGPHGARGLAPCRGERAAALESLPPTLISSKSYNDMFVEAQGILDEVRDRIPEAPDEIESLSRERLRDVMGDAQVYLFCNRHISAELLRALSETTRLLIRDAGASNLAVVFECLPAAWGERVTAALAKLKHGQSGDIRNLLERCWPWPHDHYILLFEEFLAAGVTILPGGVVIDRGLPPPDTPDMHRRPDPRLSLGRSWDDWVAAFEVTNDGCVTAARDWLRGSSGERKVVVDTGLLHHIAPHGGIRARLRAEGFQVLCDVGFLKEIEIELLEQLGPGVCASWVLLGDGFVRSPVPDLRAVLAEQWGR